MLPGPVYVYQCPHCSQLVKRNSLLSGNTLRSMLFSDGKWIRPMLPDLPNFIRCNGCHNFFWLDKAEIIGDYEWKEEQKPDWVDVKFAIFPTIDDYIDAISLNMATNIAEELFFRKNILWTFNNRVRNSKVLFAKDGDEAKWMANNERLIEMLDVVDVNDKILLAEIFRYLGEFDKCMDIISRLPTPDLDWLKVAFNKECQANNRIVFRLN